GVPAGRGGGGGVWGDPPKKGAGKTPPPGGISKQREQANPPPALAQFDRRLRRRVARGQASIDARLELHGMTQKQAHAALLHFLHQARAQDAKLALVVTGKGMGGATGSATERGALRRQVPLWLALPEFRRFIVSFEHAHDSHGGGGALYLRLRRRPR